MNQHNESTFCLGTPLTKRAKGNQDSGKATVVVTTLPICK